jgi:thiamine pyrophosphokinase
MNCLVVGSGKVQSYKLLASLAKSSELLIGADGGAFYFHKAGITPHVLIGDFDSIDPVLLESYRNLGVEIVKYPREKDFTDMELALDYAVKRKANRIFIMGATGSRMDHTMSNIQLLHKLADSGVEGVVADENNYIYLVTKSIEICKMDGYKLSLIPASETVEGITTTGLAYPLKDAALHMGTGLGISNEFVNDKASVSIKSGKLFVIVSRG